MLNNYFFDSPIDFEKRCKNRIFLGMVFLLLGLLTLLAWSVSVSYTHLVSQNFSQFQKVDQFLHFFSVGNSWSVSQSVYNLSLIHI